MRISSLRRIFIIVGIIFIGSGISGCFINYRENSNDPTFASTKQPIIDVLPETVETIQPVEPTLTNAALPKEDALAVYLDYLSTNNGCKLPCFWEITPGVSTPQDAAKILSSFENISNLTNFNFSGGFSGIDIKDGEYSFGTLVQYVLFDTESKTIDALLVTIQENQNLYPSFDHVFETEKLGDLARAYNLSNVLAELGTPASVQISTIGAEEDVIGREFQILLIYPEKGIVLNYVSRRIYDLNKISSCPGNAHINLTLLPSGDKHIFEKNLMKTSWAGFWPQSEKNRQGWLPIDQAAGMSINEFYETFKNNSDACIYTPTQIWK